VSYQYFLSRESLEVFLSLRAVQRSAILRFCEKRAEDPFRPGEFQMHDEEGRASEVSLENGCLITWYADHAVKEVRILEIETL